MKSSERRLEIRIGAFASLGAALLVIAIWLLGNTHQFFASKKTYFVTVSDAGGLLPGATVTVAGVEAGSVGAIDLPPGQQRARITLEISSQIAEAIRKDSRARLTSHGVLGDRIVDVSAGSPRLPALAPGSEIVGSGASTIGNLFGPNGDELVKTVVQIAARLNRLLASATEDDELADLLRSLISASRNAGVSAGLLNEQLRGLKLKSAVANLNSVLAKLDHGSGSGSELINDPELYDDMKALIGEVNSNRIVRNLIRKSIEDSREGQQAGTAGK